MINIKKLTIYTSLLLLMFTTVFIFKIDTVFASVELDEPANPKQVDCPPAYAGQKKCFTIDNPERKSFTMVLDKRPTPEPKTIKHVPTPTGQKPIGNHPILFAMSMVGSFAAGTDTGMAVMNEFWGQVNKVDLMAGEIANNLSDSTLLALQESYDLAVSTGSSTWSLLGDVWDQLINQTYKTMKNDALLQSTMTDLVVTQVLSDEVLNLGLQKAMSHSSGFWKKNVFSVFRESNLIEVRTWALIEGYYIPGTYVGILSKGDTVVSLHSVSIPSLSSTLKFDGLAELFEFYRTLIENPSSLVPNELPELTGTQASSLPSPSEWHIGQPRIYEDLNGDKWLETQTQLQKVKDRTQTKQKTKIITEDGIELLPDGSAGTPITKPVPPGTGTDPTEPTDPDKPNDPDKVNWQKLKMIPLAFTTAFPFSLPWDVKKALDATFGNVSRINEIKFDWKIKNHVIPIKVPDMFMGWFEFIRFFILILFDVGLIYAIRKWFGGAT